MDAYLICPETRMSLWLGKPIRLEDADGTVRTRYYHCGYENGPLNHENSFVNKVLWKFLADHAHRKLKIVFSGECDEEAYETILPVDDGEAREYIKGWPPHPDGPTKP